MGRMIDACKRRRADRSSVSVGRLCVGRGLYVASVVVAAAMTSLGVASNAGAAGFALTRADRPHAVCAPATRTRAQCMAIDVPTVAASSSDAVGPQLEGSGEGGGYSPADLRTAYNVPEAGGSGQTVAIVDAFNDPNANADLKMYRKTYKLSECTETSGCFKKVNQTGEAKEYPESNSGWASEISLDLDMVSATCPECHILLVEAKNAESLNLYEAEDEAVTLGANVVSNSWDSIEYKEEETYDTYFNHSGVPITVAAGDDGYGVSYPAASKDVISVGGTALKKESKAPRGWVEEAWRNSEKKVGEEGAGTGSGCSAYEEKPAWQHDAGCAKRTDNDVAAVASASTPVSVYDTYGAYSGWVNFGGTSAAAPIVAGIEAHAVKAIKSLGAKIFYEDASAEWDVTSGNDGSCGGSYLCTAGTGYDGPTGMGTPNGVPPSRVAEDTSPAAITNSSPNEQWSFYVNSEHEIAYWHNSLTSKGWVNGVVGGSVKAGTSPTAVVYSTGEVFLYYVNSLGEIANWTYSESQWVGRAFGGKVASGSSPFAITNPTTNYQYVFYVNSSNEVADFLLNSKEWTGPNTVGGKVKANTSPTALVYSTGEAFVYYVNSSSEIANWTLSEGKWVGRPFGGAVAAESSPFAITNRSTNYQYIYYVNSSNEVADFLLNSKEWTGPNTVGGKVKADTSPTTLVYSNGSGFVYYNSSTSEIGNWTLSEGKWVGPTAFGGEVAAKTSPYSVTDPSTNYQFVFFINKQQEIADFVFSSVGWTGPMTL
jgi:hypothetical protein